MLNTWKTLKQNLEHDQVLNKINIMDKFVGEICISSILLFFAYWLWNKNVVIFRIVGWLVSSLTIVEFCFILKLCCKDHNSARLLYFGCGLLSFINMKFLCLFLWALSPWIQFCLINTFFFWIIFCLVLPFSSYYF